MTDRVAIRRLATGVPGLDQILGGGLPEFSFNLIAGAPGAGKTTLAQLLADAALRVAGSLVFVSEGDGRLVGAGDVAQLRLVPPRRIVHGRKLGPCGDPLRVDLRLQLTCFLEVASCRPLGGVLSRLDR